MNQETKGTVTMERRDTASEAGGKPSTDLIIIGGGIAGLSAGCYAQMNGLSSRIFELHTQPGGLCTSWKRKGYTFDYCIHWLVGSTPVHGMYEIWDELGLIRGRQFINHDVFTQVEHADGRRMIFYVDPDRLRKHLSELFPADRDAIAEMCRSIKTFAGFRMFEFSLHPKQWGRLLRTLPSFAVMKRLGVMTMKEYAARFTDPWLREVISKFFGFEDMPVVGLLTTFGWMYAGCAGYPVGGSLPMATAVAERYNELGGTISFGSRVTRIITEDNHACGVRLADGTEHRARWVISAADAHATFKEMLEGSYMVPEYERHFEKKDIFPALLQVSLGIDGTLEIPQSVSWPLSKPLLVDPGEAGKPNAIEHLDLHHYGFDPTLAPEGKSVAVVRFPGTPAYWRDLAQTDPAKYSAEKERILREVIGHLEERFPGFGNRIEVTDVATPWSAERYTGNWDGCMEGWKMTPETFEQTLKGKGLPTSVPGLANFLLAGQWTVPGGGLPPSAQSGRDAVKAICRAEGRKFRVPVPSTAAAPAAAV